MAIDTTAELFGDTGLESEYKPDSDDYTGGGADDGDTEETDSSSDEELQQLDALHKSLLDSITSAYGGADAAESWKGTPAIGLSAFQGHRQDRSPSYGRTRAGQPFVRGYRSAPGAPMATPPEGLIGGQELTNLSRGVDISNPFNASLTPEKDWRATFGPKPRQTSFRGTTPSEMSKLDLPVTKGPGNYREITNGPFGSGYAG